MKMIYRTKARLRNFNEKVKRKIIHRLSPQARQHLHVVPGHIEPYIMEVVPTRQNTRVIGKNWLANFSNNEHSEHGEDGIISRIFEIMPPENKWVCEFGAHDPEIISNTWRLIHHGDWNAVLIEADQGYADKLKKYYQERKNVHCIQTMVSYEGNERLDTILSQTPIPHDMDFMVIDIDGNDYHVWEAIATYRAKVVMIEFNASIPTDVSFVQPRDMSLNQGTSLKAMTELAAKKGYKLIAVTSWNAFFIQEAYFPLFFSEEPHLDEMYVYPARHPIWMRPFQLYDGSIALAPWNEMLWHKINLSPSDYQVLPASMRVFSRQLATQNFVMEKSGAKTALKTEIAEHLEKIYQMKGNCLSRLAKNIYSRDGEDGIVEALVSNLKEPNRFVVEVGAGDGKTNSLSRNLIENHLFSALQVECDPDLLPRLKVNSAGYQAKIIEETLGGEGEQTLEAILQANKVPYQPDILILKVYGMEYFLWESLSQYSPRIVLVQFNPTIPNDVKFIQAKDSSVHQGCSLKALCDLAHYKDYELVAVTLETAIFLKRKYTYRLLELYGWQYATLEEMYCPLDMKWFQLYDGTIALRGLDRMLWHGMRIDEEKFQVVPKALRKFHQFADPENKKHFYRVS